MKPMDIGRALGIALRLVDDLESGCKRIEIAGSLRRGKPDVKDIEIAAIPRVTIEPVKDMFGSDYDTVEIFHFEEHLGNLLDLELGWEWELDPVQYVDTDMSYLHPIYQDAYVLMVSEAYALDGDLDAARARLALLALPDPAQAVGDRAEKAIAEGISVVHIRALVRLSTALGVQRDAFSPYLSDSDGGP